MTSMRLAYSTDLGKLYHGDAVEWLESQANDSADVIVADPPYGANNTVHWDRFGSLDDYVKWSETWLTEAARVLKPEGSLFVCGYAENLAYLKVFGDRHFAGCRWLVWYYRNKHAPWKSDWGRAHEGVLHFRHSKRFKFRQDAVRTPYNAHTLRYPEHPQARSSALGSKKTRETGHIWQPHPLGAKPKDVFDISTLNNGMAERTSHPTQKPEDLIRRLVLACSDRGDLVLDPFGGSGTTYVVAEKLERQWRGVEQDASYIEMAIARLAAVEPDEVRYLGEYRAMSEASDSNRELVRAGRNGKRGTAGNGRSAMSEDHGPQIFEQQVLEGP